MISSGLVSPSSSIPTKSYSPTDLTSLQGLTNEVLTAAGPEGARSQHHRAHGQHVGDLDAAGPGRRDGHASAALSNLAGYLQPGSHVDVYANITKISAGGAAGGRLPRSRCRAPSWP